MNKSKLIILAGIPGSGKSTWAHRFFDADSIVSSDAIREELYGDDPYDPDRNAVVFVLFHRLLEQKLEDGECAVADSTALTKEARANLREVAAKHNAEVHVVLFTNNAQAFENNLKRAERWIVPYKAQEAMYRKYLDARYNIPDEGYNSITFISEVR